MPIRSRSRVATLVRDWVNADTAIASRRISGHPTISKNLIAYWALEEASGTRNDSYGANNLTDNNTVGQTTGVQGNCALFASASSEYFNVTDNAALSTGDVDFAFSLWFYLNSLGNYQALVAKGKWSGVNNTEYVLRVTNTNVMEWYVGVTGASNQVVTSTIAFVTSLWYHVYCYHDSVNNTIGLSINGATPLTAAWANGATDTAYDFQMGVMETASPQQYYLDGRMDEVAFFKGGLLSQLEREYIYSIGVGTAY